MQNKKKELNPGQEASGGSNHQKNTYINKKNSFNPGQEASGGSKTTNKYIYCFKKGSNLGQEASYSIIRFLLGLNCGS